MLMGYTAASLTANGLGWGERLSTAGTVALEGMLVIFCVLALLWGVIEIMHKLLYREPKAELQPAKAENEAPESVAKDPASDDGAVVAAIIAAISAMRAENGTTGGFRVVSFRKSRTK